LVETSAERQFDRGRGRGADAPTDIPMRGWKDVAWRLYKSINDDRILLTAAGVTFYVLLALVPTLTAIVSIYGLFNDRSTVVEQVSLLYGIVPPGGLELIREQLTRLTAEGSDTLGLTLVVSLALALWSSSAGIKALFEAMNVAYHETEKRNFFHLNGLALLFTLCGAIAAVLVLATVLAIPPLLTLLPIGAAVEWAVRIASYLIMLVVIWMGLTVLYRWGPSRQTAKWRWITPGAAVSVVLLGIASVAFSWYATNFSDYGAAYGSLGALIGLMTWIWISATIVIVGAELNSEVEHQTARDSTTGEPAPLGQRGAHMADTIGEVNPMDLADVAIRRRPERQRQRIAWGALAIAAPVALLDRFLHRGASR
jgi:membrane protein